MTDSFDVFLSHNSRDKPAVRELAEALHARGLKVWLDEWELIPGRPWQEALEEIIETTRSAAVLVGTDGIGPWHNAEMRGCLSQFVKRQLPVIPVLLPGAPEAPELPIFLSEFTWVDLRAGLTAEGIGRLVWGITGTRPESSQASPVNAGRPASPEIAATAPSVASGTRKVAGWRFWFAVSGLVAVVLLLVLYLGHARLFAPRHQPDFRTVVLLDAPWEGSLLNTATATRARVHLKFRAAGDQRVVASYAIGGGPWDGEYEVHAEENGEFTFTTGSSGKPRWVLRRSEDTLRGELEEKGMRVATVELHHLPPEFPAVPRP